MAECLQDVTLADLSNMLEDGETVLCRVNDFVLEDIRASGIPGICDNAVAWVTGMDISELDASVVSLSVERGRVRTVPMENFMKAWKTSQYRAMVIQAGE